VGDATAPDEDTPKVQSPTSLLAQVTKDHGRMPREGLLRSWDDHEGDENNQESIGPRLPHGASGTAPRTLKPLGARQRGTARLGNQYGTPR